MRIAFVISSLSVGGAEHVASGLANHWAGSGSQVTFVTIDSCRTDFYRLDERVTRIALALLENSQNSWRFLWNNLRRALRIRAAIMAAGPEVVVSFLDATNVLVLLATLGLGIPVVVSERTDPRKKPTSLLVRMLRQKLYRRAHALIVQTRGVGSWALQVIDENRIKVIPNAVIREPVGSRQEASTGKSAFTVLSMGRLGVEKGFDLLLRAFARCTNKHPNWRLRIIGEGPERSRLAALARQLGIMNKVRIDSITKDPAEALREGDLFVLSSRYEGFPNALLEAMAAGLPVISCDCQSGPSEIIRDGIDGVLVPPEDVNSLAAAMDRLMATESERKRLASRAVEVTERFDHGRVMQMWDQVLEEAVA